MRTVLRFARTMRATTLLILTALTLLIAAGAATAAYSGITPAGDIRACFKKSTGELRVSHRPLCKRNERALRWNSRGKAGPAGVAGAQGAAGPQGGSGSAGRTGAAGKDGATGMPGLPGVDGVPGVAGSDGAPGRDGAAGPAGPQGPAGPAGPAGRGSGMQFAQAVNNTDPDCAMVGPIGRTTAASCNFTSVHAVGEYLPSSLIVSGFRVLLDRTVSSPVDVFARAITPDGNTSVDAFILCSVPAGSNTCAQTGERSLTGQTLFMLQIGGDRSWTKARFGYSLVQA